MAAFSVLRTLGDYRNILLKLPAFCKNYVSTNSIQVSCRSMSGGPRTMFITPSRFAYKQTKDSLHFYTAIGVIPLGLLIFCVNVFVGQAELAEIPEGYEPKHWEYHKHPIKRFISKYFHRSPQHHYEQAMHSLNESKEKGDWRETCSKVKRLQLERDDYKGLFFYPSAIGKFFRRGRYSIDKIDENHGYK